MKKKNNQTKEKVSLGIDKKYSIIYADPPWSYRGRKQFGFAGDVGVDSGGAINHYKTMSVEEICALDVPSICEPDCLLFVWIPNPLVPDGLRVMEAWGFAYATVAFVWDKQKTNPGYYTLSQCELCYVGKRGRIPSPRCSRRERQLVSEPRGKHSVKPEYVGISISEMFPTQRKIELFARCEPYMHLVFDNHGTPIDTYWDVWGDEAR